MPACAESLRYLGNQQMTDVDAVVDRLERLHRPHRVRRGVEPQVRREHRAGKGQGHAIWHSSSSSPTVSRAGSPEEFPDLRGPTARAGAASCRWRCSSTSRPRSWSTTSRLTEGRGTDAPPNLLPINDASMVRTQAHDRRRGREDADRRHRSRRAGSFLRAVEQPLGCRSRIRAPTGARPTSRGCTASSSSGSPCCRPGCSPI